MVWPIVRRVLALLILSGVSSFSHATVFYYYALSSTNWTNSPSDVCSYYQANNYPTYAVTLKSVRESDGYVLCDVKSGDTFITTAGKARSQINCPEPKVLDLATRQCTLPPEEPPCEQGQTVTLSVYCGSWSCSGAMEGSVCIGTLNVNDGAFPMNVVKNSCNALLNSVFPGNYGEQADLPSGGGALYCSASYTLDGTQASGPDTNEPGGLTSLPQSQQCPTGTQPGIFNGQTVCVPCASGAACNGSGPGGDGPPDGGSNPPDGDGDGDGNDDGSGDDDGSGSTGGTCSAEQQAAGQCTGPGGSGTCSAEQQAAGQCTGPGGNGGNGNGTGTYAGTDTCTAAPTCTGDPLTCGGIIQNWKDLCRLTNVTNDQRNAASARGLQARTAYIEEKAAKDGQVQGFFENFQSAVSSGNQGACPADITVNVMGKSITARLSQTCDFFRFFRLITLTIAYLGAAAIIFKAL